MTGERTARERRLTSTSVTSVHVIIHAETRHSALAGCHSGFFSQCFMSHLSHRLPPASPPHTPELLKVITEPAPKLVLSVILKYLSLFSHCFPKNSCRSSSEGQRKSVSHPFILPAGGQLFTNSTKHTEIQIIAFTTEIVRVLKMLLSA